MKIKLKNNVRTTMASRDITMWKELAERLKGNQNYSITRTSLARQIEKDVPAYSLQLIEALCNELQCLPNDLYQIEVSEASKEEVGKLTRRDKPFEFGHIIEADQENEQKTDAVTPDDWDENDDLVGGRVSHLSIEKTKMQPQ